MYKETQDNLWSPIAALLARSMSQFEVFSTVYISLCADFLEATCHCLTYW